jgi:hypothetical protein
MESFAPGPVKMLSASPDLLFLKTPQHINYFIGY